MQRERRPVSIHHLGDGEAGPTGDVAEAKAIAAARPGVQAALAGAMWGRRQGCVFPWWAFGLSPRGRAGALWGGGGLHAFQEEERGQAHLEAARTDLLPPTAHTLPAAPWPLPLPHVPF